MEEKRKDSKGRILRSGESQRADGMYMFRYTDKGGVRRTIYSWKLVETDKQPSGKKENAPLREAEKAIQKDVIDGIDSNGANKKTINDLFTMYMELRDDLAVTTRCGYKSLYDTHVRKRIGNRKVSDLKHSDITRVYTNILNEDPINYSTLEKIHTLLYQLFDIAVLDNIIRDNPTKAALKNIKKKTKRDKPEKRCALTEDQQSRLIEFIYHSEKFKDWGPFFTILLGTGMRIGEMLGLRWDDCDFETCTIDINHIVLYKTTETTGYKYMISSPKTIAGYRKIPMLLDVKNALLTEMNRPHKRKSATIDGYTNFIFINSRGNVLPPPFVYKKIQKIVSEYNKSEDELSGKEGREPDFIPKISAHIFRHTFCTRICENEVNIKVIQSVMGHSNISTTMNIYADATEKKKRESFDNIDGKIKIASMA